MGYYLRLFTTRREQVAAREFFDSLEEVAGTKPAIALNGTELDWKQILVLSADNREVCIIEHSAADDGSGLFEEEIGEFKELLGDALPRRGATWVSKYLDQVRRIYAVRFLDGGFDEDVSPSPAEVLWALKLVAGGITQADDEGMSNEDGFTVVWQFSDDASGPWNFAVLDADDGQWRNVTFDLSDSQRRIAFQDGTL